MDVYVCLAAQLHSSHGSAQAHKPQGEAVQACSPRRSRPETRQSGVDHSGPALGGKWQSQALQHTRRGMVACKNMASPQCPVQECCVERAADRDPACATHSKHHPCRPAHPALRKVARLCGRAPTPGTRARLRAPRAAGAPRHAARPAAAARATPAASRR